ncbi:MAG TPA: hypothetical protein DD979_15065 [Gammaproteobacteria bacterium]|jgi:hypothetical protein|nr:hypothetical protein [Gammaproteobacteria bacterium]
MSAKVSLFFLILIVSTLTSQATAQGFFTLQVASSVTTVIRATADEGSPPPSEEEQTEGEEDEEPDCE